MVRPKKHLGQHFLKDENIARKIVSNLTGFGGYKTVLEVGPGMGVLTKYLWEDPDIKAFVVEVDRDSIDHLKANYPEKSDQIITADFLKMDLQKQFQEPIAIIGNFPYNISSQIFFKILEHRDMVPECVGMIQKEVAQRIAEPPGSKTYGITSVLLQAFYNIDYLFSVSPNVFVPPPRVNSAVIRLQRNERKELECDEKLFFKVVKTAFNQRRKTLRNALKSLTFTSEVQSGLLTQRAEQLSVEDFIELTALVEKAGLRE